MAAGRHGGDMEPHRLSIREKMEYKVYASEFIDQIFEQIKGFGSYGFPQSHAASFAKLVYASCWLKRHEPAAFACALLNAQPMGFYSPSQIVQDARRGRGAREGVERSEEHTSELQSLMRISYAVFRLKKKNTNKLYTIK